MVTKALSRSAAAANMLAHVLPGAPGDQGLGGWLGSTVKALRDAARLVPRKTVALFQYNNVGIYRMHSARAARSWSWSSTGT